MKPNKITTKDEFLLGGFHVGAEREGVNHWEKFESQTEPLTNAVDDSGFEVRFHPPEGERIFTGVQVRDRAVAPAYEILEVPAATYAVFDINCKKNMQRQFDGIDKWLEKNKDAYTQRDWDGAPYVVCWYGRFYQEKIFEMWVPLIKQ